MLGGRPIAGRETQREIGEMTFGTTEYANGELDLRGQPARGPCRRKLNSIKLSGLPVEPQGANKKLPLCIQSRIVGPGSRRYWSLKSFLLPSARNKSNRK